MSLLEEMMGRLPRDGVEFKTLGEVGTFIRGNGLQKKDFAESGVGCIHYGQIHTHYGVWATDTITWVSPTLAKRLRLARTGDLVVATTSEDDEAVGKAVAWLGADDVAVSSDACIYRHSLDPKFVAYFFQSEQFRSQKQSHITGTKMRRLSGDNLAKIRIPVPPVEIQREIGEVLDRFRELEAELEAKLAAELEARRRQYHHYRDAVLTFDGSGARQKVVMWTTIVDICKSVTSGGTPSTSHNEYYGGDIPWLRTDEVDFGEIESTKLRITEAGLRNSSAKWIPAGCVVVAMYGATAAKVAINAIPLTTNQACCNLEIDSTQALPRFVFHWLSFGYERLRALGEGSQSNLSLQKVKGFRIAVPPLDEQARIVAILDHFDALVDDLSIGLPAELKARRQQYAYYRDLLLTFKEAA